MSALARTLRRGLSTSATPKTLAKIDSLYHMTDLDAFLSRLRRLSSSSPLPASIYAVASRRLASAGRHSEAAAILSSLAPRLSPPALIALYGKASLPDLAVQAYRSHPTLPSFNALLSALPPDAAVRHFDAAPASVSPDLASYTILVAALCRVGDLDRAARTLRLMEDNGVPPNAATFNALLSALYRSGRAEEAEAVWREMEEKGRGPNVRSYNAKMRWLVSARRTAEAAEIFSQMEAAGITPDGYSITALIVGYCNDGNLRQGKRLMEDLRRRKLDPTPWTYEALVPRMCEANELDSALSLCYESIRNRCYVGAGILQVVVDGLVGSSRVADARRLVEMAWSRHYTRDSLIMPRECLELIESEKQGKMQKEMKEREDGVKGSLVLSTVSGGEGEGSQKGTNNGGASAKIGIIVKSFDKPKYMGAFGVPPDKNRVKLPTTRTLITVLRSPHIDKKSREQFEMKVRREYITVKCQPHELQKKYFWFKRARVLGAQFELVFSYKTRLDMGRLKQSV